MKLKFTQKILVSYYRTKLKAIGIVSERKAAEVAFKLFCTPYIRKSKKESPAVFHKAEKLSFTIQKHLVKGFRWKSSHPNNKTILICHGFNSSCYKFDKYISLFLKEGFTVLAFDAPAHGLSEGKMVNGLIYKDMILQVESLYGPVDIIMAHSLGGLAASLAAEEMEGLKKMVLIAPATETISAVYNFCRIAHIKSDIRKEMENMILAINGKPMSWYSITRAAPNIKANILWVHDDGDTVCPYRDTKKIQQLQLPNVRFITTQHLGHSKIYRDSKIQKMIVDFTLS